MWESSVVGGWGSGNRDMEGIATRAFAMWRAQRTRAFPSCIRMRLYCRHYPLNLERLTRAGQDGLDDCADRTWVFGHGLANTHACVSHGATVLMTPPCGPR